jgi:hypothetical protein
MHQKLHTLLVLPDCFFAEALEFFDEMFGPGVQVERGYEVRVGGKVVEGDGLVVEGGPGGTIRRAGWR